MEISIEWSPVAIVIGILLGGFINFLFLRVFWGYAGKDDDKEAVLIVGSIVLIFVELFGCMVNLRYCGACLIGSAMFYIATLVSLLVISLFTKCVGSGRFNNDFETVAYSRKPKRSSLTLGIVFIYLGALVAFSGVLLHLTVCAKYENKRIYTDKVFVNLKDLPYVEIAGKEGTYRKYTGSHNYVELSEALRKCDIEDAGVFCGEVDHVNISCDVFQKARKVIEDENIPFIKVK